MIRCRVELLNQITGNPPAPYTKTADGKFVANLGNFHLSRAYGGVCIHQMQNLSGGVTTPIFCGHVPMREAYDKLNAFISGIEYGKKMERGAA